MLVSMLVLSGATGCNEAKTMIEGKRILLGVTGGVWASKNALFTRRLSQDGGPGECLHTAGA